MNIEIHGLNQVTKTLSDGTEKTYFYFGKGGPRIEGEPSSPEFLDNLRAIQRARGEKSAKTIADILDQFERSKYFRDKIKPVTEIRRSGSIRYIKRDAIAELTVAALSDPRTREILEDWRDEKAKKTPGQARTDWQTLAKAMTWAVDQRIIKINPCRGVAPLYSGSRIDKLWSDEQIAKFCNEAPSHFVIAFMLALWTGQREGSLIKLRWSAYDGRFLWVEQEKTRKNQPPKMVVIPVLGAFKIFMDELEQKRGVAGLSKEERHEHHIILTHRGKPWADAASFSRAFGKANSKIVQDRTFHDLRGTAVTRLARAGCTVPQIATITGHSLKTVQVMLDKHYLSRDIVLAEQAMQKRDEYEASQLPSQLLEIVQ